MRSVLHCVHKFAVYSELSIHKFAVYSVLRVATVSVHRGVVATVNLVYTNSLYTMN